MRAYDVIFMGFEVEEEDLIECLSSKLMTAE
jgi:hypothetical protein